MTLQLFDSWLFLRHYIINCSCFRIERLWRDVYEHVLDMFYHIFYNLEAEGQLNPDSDAHIFALHWIFIPHLQRHLAFFKEAWNHHRLRTEGNQSPIQLWMGHRTHIREDPIQVNSQIVTKRTL